MKRYFLWHSLRELAKFLEVKLMYPLWLPSLPEFITLTLNLQQFNRSGFSTWPLVPWFPLMGFCSSKLWFSVFVCLSLQCWRQKSALWPHFSSKSKRSYRFFSLFTFLLIRTRWWLQNSLHARLEIRSTHFFSSLPVLSFLISTLRFKEDSIYDQTLP